MTWLSHPAGQLHQVGLQWFARMGGTTPVLTKVLCQNEHITFTAHVDKHDKVIGYDLLLTTDLKLMPSKTWLMMFNDLNTPNTNPTDLHADKNVRLVGFAPGNYLLALNIKNDD